MHFHRSCLFGQRGDVGIHAACVILKRRTGIGRQVRQRGEEGIELGGGRSAKVGASIGVSFGGTDTDIDTLIRRADLAMYTAKRRGKGRTETYQAHMVTDVKHRLAMEEALRGAALWDEVKDRLQESGMSLSGGQQQRLVIARAIALEPEVLLLDEPASALDPISTAKIEELVTEMKDKYTIIIVTHNMQQAARVSDYTAFMYIGELIEFGRTNDLFLKPAVKQTEDYITGRFG